MHIVSSYITKRKALSIFSESNLHRQRVIGLYFNSICNEFPTSIFKTSKEINISNPNKRVKEKQTEYKECYKVDIHWS